MNTFGLPDSPLYDIKRFTGNTLTSGGDWQVWAKPKGKSMVSIFLLGCGGNGGTGVVGTNSNAGGGGGGGSGAQVNVVMPLHLLPDELYISLAMGGAGVSSFVSIQPSNTADYLVARATSGAAGANAAGGTGGALGAAGSVSTVGTMPIGWPFAGVVAGQDGVAGGNAVAAAALTLPLTGLRATGGTGGGGLPAAAAAGTSGGSFTVPAAPSPFPAQKGGTGSATATAPADHGSGGYTVTAGGIFFYGGTGGASTHGTATGGGLVQSNGGPGGYGSGGGGVGGALTASAAGNIGKGGPGLCIFTCW